MNEKRLGIQQALPKLKQYCTYQERCHIEVKEKLNAYGLYGQEASNIIATLVEENYLNEQRFAIQFAGGHFRLKQWGRVKIKHALKQKQINDYCIRKALEQIEDQNYLNLLRELCEKKARSLKSEKNSYVRKRKLQTFLLQRGFESDLIKEELTKL